MSKINCKLFNFYGNSFEDDLDFMLKNPIHNISNIKLPLSKPPLLKFDILEATNNFLKKELENQNNKPLKKRKRFDC